MQGIDQIRRFFNYLELRKYWKEHLFLTVLTITLGSLGSTPFSHPDFLEDKVLRVLRSNGNPVVFVYPALVTYTSTIFYLIDIAVKEIAGLVSGSTQQMGQVFNQILRDGIQSMFPGHLVTLMFAVLGVNTLFLLAKEIVKDRFFSLLAALILTTSLLWTAETHFFTVDIPLTSMALLTVYATVVFTREGINLRWPHLVLLGALVGLTTSAKYTGVVIAVPVAGALFFMERNKLKWLQQTLIVGGSSLLFFLLTNPFILTESARLIQDLQFHLNNSKVGFVGYSIPPIWMFYLMDMPVYALGIPFLLLTLLGLVWFALKKEFRLATKIALVFFPVLFLLMNSTSEMTFKRYFLPALPYYSLFAATGLFAIYQWSAKRFDLKGSGWYKAIFIGLGILTLIPNLWKSLQHDRLLAGQDTREQFIQLINKSQLAESDLSIYAATYLEEYFPRGRAITRWQNVNTEQVDVIALDSFSIDRYLYDRSLSPDMPPKAGKYDPGFLNFNPDALSGRSLLRLTPFRNPKEQVPFSPESLYSPYLPDISYRSLAGPFIEIYSTDMQIIQDMMAICTQSGYQCHVIPSEEGYYAQGLSYR